MDLVLLDLTFCWEVVSFPAASLCPGLSHNPQGLSSHPAVASAAMVSSVSDLRYMLHWQGTLELADLPLQKGSVELLKQRWESTNATRPGPTLQCSPAPRSLVLGKISCSSTVEKVPADSRRVDVFKEETLGGLQQIEHFPITVEELRSHFEALGGKKVSAWAGQTPRGNGDGLQGYFPSLIPPLSCALPGMGSAGHSSCGYPVDNLDQYLILSVL